VEEALALRCAACAPAPDRGWLDAQPVPAPDRGLDELAARGGAWMRRRQRRAHMACRCGCRDGRDTLMGGGDGGTNGCVVGGEALGVSGPQKPKFSSIWVERRVRNGSGTARGTAEYRPRSRPALLLEVMNDRAESHCHRTRHRGGRTLPVPGCPTAVFPDALP
jgi:hypothetical protein